MKKRMHLLTYTIVVFRFGSCLVSCIDSGRGLLAQVSEVAANKQYFTFMHVWHGLMVVQAVNCVYVYV